MAGPLDGVVVVDLSRVLAGPYCTMMLADLGAEVIKVERPGTGDDARAFGPFVKGESAYFMSVNRGKKSVTLDLQKPRGKELLLELVARADVLVENFKPGVMKRLGLDWEQLRRKNPRLVYAASTGFGQTGPYSARPAYDLIIQGMGGLMSITGPDAASPTKVGTSIADILAGLFTTIGVLAALQRRERTGEGQQVDVAMLDCMVAVLENAIARCLVTGQSPAPLGNRHPSIAPFTTIPTSDGALTLACGNDELWARFCRVVGLDALIQDPRFKSNGDRCAHWAELEPLIEERTRTFASGQLVEALQAVDVPCGPIQQVAQVLEDPQVLARKMLAEVVHPVVGPMKVPGAPIKLSASPAEVRGPAPTLGQHNLEIYAQRLGLGEQAVLQLREERVI